MSAATVESIKPISNGGNLKASAILNIAGKLRINDIRIIKQENQKPWISMPSRAYELNGARRWAQIIEILDYGLKNKLLMPFWRNSHGSISHRAHQRRAEQ